MNAPPNDDSSPDFADRLDNALAALWRGDGGQFDDLVDPNGPTGPRIGEVFEGGASEHAAQVLGPFAEPTVTGYEIQERIAQGGMGVVYKARQLFTKRVVALKVMLAGSSASQAARRRFRREVELTARFQHPGIVRVLEGGETCAGQPYYAMDYVAGVPLKDWIAATNPDARTIATLFLELCDGVDYAHRHDVVHSDLKPGNVLIDNDGEPHILDFGLARALDGGLSEDGLSSHDSPGGTLPYLSPEQATGTPEDIDARTDVWALGTMLFEALTGQLPFSPAESRLELRQRICYDSPRSPSLLSDNVDRGLEAVILKALAKEKADRYQSAREMGEDLQRYLTGEPISAVRGSIAYLLRKKLARHQPGGALVVWIMGVAYLLRKRLARHRGGWALVAVGLLVVFGIVFTAKRAQYHDLLDARRTVLRLQSDQEAGCPYPWSLEEAGKRHPELPELWLARAQHRFRSRKEREKIGDSGKVDTAIGILETAVASYPSSQWAYHFLLAEIYHHMGNRAKAEHFENAAEAEYPHHTSEGRYLRSFTTLEPGDVRLFARAALDLDPKHALAWERLARACKQIGALDCAIKGAREAILWGGDDYERRIFLGNLFTLASRYSEAVEQSTRAIAIAPANITLVHAYKARGTARLCLGDYDEAIEDYGKVAEMAKLGTMPCPWSRYYRATALWIEGRRAEAAVDYELVRSKEKTSALYADARLFLLLNEEARFLNMQGRWVEAHKARSQASDALERGLGDSALGTWQHKVFKCLAGELTPQELVKAADQRNEAQVCESYYYAAEMCLLNRLTEQARAWFQKCKETKLIFDPNAWELVPMNEYHLAVWRLRQLTEESEASPGKDGG